MKHRYHIQGMTCKGLPQARRKNTFKCERGFKCHVDLEKAEATIEMEKHIPFETFQEVLEKDGATI
jgi:P-type Cu+ transporter